MREIPLEKEAQFEEAVSLFSEASEIVVTTEKLDAFLRATADFLLSPEERLRQLAIALESQTFALGWAGLRAIYQAAAQINPQDSYVFHSWGISAGNWYTAWQTPDLAPRMEIAAEAEQVLLTALALEPEQSFIAYSLGEIYYFHPSKQEEWEPYLHKALSWFQRAIEWDAENAIAQLYVAHCHHDLAFRYAEPHYWEQAVQAYEAVDQEQLALGWPAWRAVKCREQLAYCNAMAGREAAALAQFSAFLTEVEQYELSHGLQVAVVNFDELVAAVTQKLTDASLLHRTQVQVNRYRFRTWYPELFSSADCDSELEDEEAF